MKSVPAPLDPAKLRLLDLAVERFGMRSCADLGGVWNVDGGYTFYAAKPGVERGFLVDTDISSGVAAMQAVHPNVEILQGNFGDPAVVSRLPNIDAVLFFDTLLHQVDPDWDRVLELYADRARLFLVFNQQYIAPATVRLLDLGRDEYFRNVPHSPADDVYRMAFDYPDEIHPRHARPWRDIHHIWQWGITDRDLVRKMKALGFGLRYYRNHGPFGNLPRFENHAFLFSRGPSALLPELRYGAAQLARQFHSASAPLPARRV